MTQRLAILYRVSKPRTSFQASIGFRRLFHRATAILTTKDAAGDLASKQIDIFIGDPGEAYVMFSKSISSDFTAGMLDHKDVLPEVDLAGLPLVFQHNGNYFAQAAEMYPRITISQDMPRQSDSQQSPATLWGGAASDCITLNGTADGSFELASRETYRRLRGAAALLAQR